MARALQVLVDSVANDTLHRLLLNTIPQSDIVPTPRPELMKELTNGKLEVNGQMAALAELAKSSGGDACYVLAAVPDGHASVLQLLQGGANPDDGTRFQSIGFVPGGSLLVFEAPRLLASVCAGHLQTKIKMEPQRAIIILRHLLETLLVLSEGRSLEYLPGDAITSLGGVRPFVSWSSMPPPRVGATQAVMQGEDVELQRRETSQQREAAALRQTLNAIGFTQQLPDDLGGYIRSGGATIKNLLLHPTVFETNNSPLLPKLLQAALFGVLPQATATEARQLDRLQKDWGSGLTGDLVQVLAQTDLDEQQIVERQATLFDDMLLFSDGTCWVINVLQGLGSFRSLARDKQDIRGIVAGVRNWTNHHDTIGGTPVTARSVAAAAGASSDAEVQPQLHADDSALQRHFASKMPQSFVKRCILKLQALDGPMGELVDQKLRSHFKMMRFPVSGALCRSKADLVAAAVAAAAEPAAADGDDSPPPLKKPKISSQVHTKEDRALLKAYRLALDKATSAAEDTVQAQLQLPSSLPGPVLELPVVLARFAGQLAVQAGCNAVAVGENAAAAVHAATNDGKLDVARICSMLRLLQLWHTWRPHLQQLCSTTAADTTSNTTAARSKKKELLLAWLNTLDALQRELAGLGFPKLAQRGALPPFSRGITQQRSSAQKALAGLGSAAAGV